MTCEEVSTPDGVIFLCGRGRPRIICDVCDKTVPRNHPRGTWNGHEVDLCSTCEKRTRDDDEYRVWASRQIAKHYPGGCVVMNLFDVLPEVEDEYAPEPDCSWCGGEGVQECDRGDCYCGDYHRCPACNGSGDAKDQTLW